jgi:Xaa-Pro dipeptidase
MAASALLAPPWPSDAAFPRYSEAEYTRRWERLRSIMSAADVDVAIVAGSGSGRAEVQFLTNAPVRWESLLVVSASDEGDPKIVMSLDNHAAGLQPWSTVPIEAVGPDVAGEVAREVVRRSGSGGTVGLLGPVSERTASALRAALPGCTFVGLGPAFTRERMIKSEEELAWTRYGAAICDHAVSRFLDEARPGLREDELGGIMHAAVLAVGGQLGILFLASASMVTGGAVAPLQTWSRRPTTAEDLVVFELSAGFGGATGQILRTVSLGAAPSDVVRELHAVADRTFERIFETIAPGVPFEALEAVGAEIEDAGFSIVDDLVHGYGGGYLQPHVRTPGTRREAPGDGVLEPDMLLVIQPNVVTPDRRFGVQTGELIVVTEAGAESMHSAPRGQLTTSGGS